jgi:single-stranded DNA-binding protein
VNQWRGIGHLAKDPITREFGGGKRVLTFSMAVNERYWSKKENCYKDKPPLWLGVSVWSRIELFEKLLHKGDRILAIGSISVSTKGDKQYVNLNITDMRDDKHMLLIIPKVPRTPGGRDDEYTLAEEDEAKIAVDEEDESPF